MSDPAPAAPGDADASASAAARRPEPDARIPLPAKLGYASGALADNLIMNGFAALVLPVYNIGLAVNPALLGWAMGIPRLLDAITDPLMGILSDNTRSRWGRRKPYVVAGAIACAALLPLLWLSPFKSDWAVFGWLTVFGCLYFLAYTVFIIPWQAMGFEMTGDYDERTRLLAWPNYIGLTASFFMPWLPAMIEWDRFGGPVRGAVVVSIGMGVIILVAGILPAIVGRERAGTQAQPVVKVGDAVQLTLQNRPFLLVVAANVLVLLGLATFVSLSLYVNIYYIFGGDVDAGARLAGMAGSLYAGVSYVSVLLASKIGTTLGKKRAAQVLLSLTLVGVASLYWTLTPEQPLLQLVSVAIIGFGLQGTWMIFFIMIGDVCEEDELENGLRREGIFSAVGGFSRKAAVAVAAIASGTLLNAVGFDAEAAKETGIDPAVAQLLKNTYVIGQAGVVLLGLVLISFYPITRERAMETQRKLKTRQDHAAQRSEASIRSH